MPRGAGSAADGRGYLLVAGAATSWGTWSLFLRQAERRGPIAPALEALLVMAVTTLVALPLALASPRRARGRAAWLTVAAVGLGDALNILFFFQAMRLTTVAVAVLTHSIAPLLVASLAPLVTGERAGRRVLAAAAAALGGLSLLLEPWRSPPAGALAGAACGAASAVFYAGNVLLQKRLGDAFTPAEITAYHGLPSCLVIALAVPADGFSASPAQLAIISVAAVGPGALAALAFVRALQLIPASHAAVLALLEPLVAVLVGVVVWGEPLRPVSGLGALVVVLALVVAVTPGARPTTEQRAGRWG